MKNIKYTWVACVMLLVFVACGNVQNQTEKEDDTAPAKEIDTTPTQEIDTTPLVTTSPDLVLFDLQGPVKSCDMVDGWYLVFCQHLEFNRSGLITLVDGKDPFAVGEQNYTDELEYHWYRDDQGQISSVAIGWSGQQFTWVDGRITSPITGFHEDLHHKYEFEYDSEGHIGKQTIYSGNDDMVEAGEWELYRFEEYTYLDFDDHGNWTRCKVKYHEYESDYDDEYEYTRKIEYY